MESKKRKKIINREKRNDKEKKRERKEYIMRCEKYKKNSIVKCFSLEQ